MNPNEQPQNSRGQLAYPLDLQSEGVLKFALENVLKDVIVRANRIQLTLPLGATNFNVASSYMVMSAQAAVTIATIGGGREGMILTLQFTDTNITITDTGTGVENTVNLVAAFTSTANTILQLKHDGTSWREICRSTSGSSTGSSLFMLGARNDSLTFGVTRYENSIGVYDTEAKASFVIPKAGTIKNLYVQAATNTLNGNTVYTIVKNGTPTAVTLTIATTVLTGSDIVNTVAVSAGDYITIQVDTTASGSGAMTNRTIGFEIAL